GDNLFRIGLKFNMSWTVIAARNGITNPNAIFPGQRLIIPSP
ncbi:MAG: peptidoglycan-binding protein, partial [Thermoflexus sp.]